MVMKGCLLFKMKVRERGEDLGAVTVLCYWWKISACWRFMRRTAGAKWGQRSMCRWHLMMEFGGGLEAFLGDFNGVNAWRDYMWKKWSYGEEVFFFKWVGRLFMVKCRWSGHEGEKKMIYYLILFGFFSFLVIQFFFFFHEERCYMGGATNDGCRK